MRKLQKHTISCNIIYFNFNQPLLQSTSTPINLNFNQPQPQSTSTSINLNSIWLWHQSNPILLLILWKSRLLNNYKYFCLNKHRKSVHEEVKHPCVQYLYQATTMGDLERHIRSVHEGMKYSCGHCEYQATQKGHLEQHRRSVHEAMKYACGQCKH